MKRFHKICFGIVTIILALISAGIGFFLISNARDSYNFLIRFLLNFCFTITPIFTVLAVINLLKKDE